MRHECSTPSPDGLSLTTMANAATPKAGSAPTRAGAGRQGLASLFGEAWPKVSGSRPSPPTGFGEDPASPAIPLQKERRTAR